MATIPLRGMRVVGNFNEEGNADKYLTNQLKNTAAATFSGGGLLKLVTNALSPVAVGETIGAGDDNLSDTNVLTAGGLWGLALESALTGVTKNLFAQQLSPGVVIEGNLVTGADGDTASALVDGSRLPNATMALVLAVTHLYATVGILLDATAKLAYFTATPTVAGHANLATIIRIGMGIAGDSMGAIGDTNARVYAVIRPNVLTLGLVSS